MLGILQKNILLNTFTKIIKILPSRKKRQGIIIFAGMAGFAGLETIAVGCIALYASAVSHPDIVNSKHISFVKQYFNFDLLNDPLSLIIALSILMVALVLLKNIFLATITYASAKFSELISAFFGELLLSGFLGMPYEWHLHQNSADIILAVNWRVYFGIFVKSILQIIRDSLVVLVMLTALFIVEPIISLFVFFALGGCSIIIFNKIRGSIDKTTIKARDYKKTINRNVTMNLQAVKDIKVFARENSCLKDYKNNVSISTRLNALQIFLSGVPVWLMESLAFFMLAISICFMLIIMDSSSVKVTGTVALLAVTAWKVLPSITRILSALTRIRTSIPYVQKGLEYLHEITSKIDSIKIASHQIEHQFNFNSEIRVENISFSYQDRSIFALKDISFCIKKGQSVGIIGISGAGKSTLVDILIGLFPPKNGRILIDNQMLNDKLRKSWIYKVGYVPQNSYIFDGTLSENVAFGQENGEINRERVLESCEMAAMQNFLHDLPANIDTPIGERGVRLSGGQRQRVAIARALYRNPDVMIFDEATSSLDMKSEKEIQQTINSLKGKQTLIIVAHRLSTVAECDFLIWIENGKIKNIGHPDEILHLYNNGQTISP